MSAAVILLLGLALAALAAPAGAAKGGEPDRAGPADGQSLRIWAYFDGDTPVSGGQVRVYADGRRLSEQRRRPGPVTTFSGGQALLRFNSLPSALRIVVSGGRADGKRVDGSLTRKVRGVSDGDLVHVNPVTTVSARLARESPGLRHPRKLTERTLGIRPILDDSDLYATDRWFDGDRFLRWALKRGSVGAGARALVRLIKRPGFDRRRFKRPGFDRRRFDPPAGGGPEAGVASGGGASARKALNGLATTDQPCPGADHAKDVIGGLTDAFVGAASLTGPEGFAAGLAATVFKKLIDLGLGACVVEAAAEDPVKTALRGLSAQVAELKRHVDGKFLKLQIADTEHTVDKIRDAHDDFLDMLKYARDKKRGGLIESTAAFVKNAQGLDRAPAQLDRALRDKQEGGTQTNPLKGPALIPAVREQVGGDRFFTNQDSRTIQRFFKYYEWAQTQLATVLTEYYGLGGNCAVSFVNNHPRDLLTSEDCDPVDDVQQDKVKVIQENIASQRATLPRVLDPRVFIDRNTKRMWLTDLTTRSPREIVTTRGLVVEKCPGTPRTRTDPCRASLFGNNYYFGLDSELGWRFQNPPGWHIPTANDYRDLFAGPGPGEPLARLNSLGVRQNGGPINWPYFWLAGDFYVEMNGGWLSIRGQNRVEAVVFKLVPGAQGPETQRVKVGTGCNWASRDEGRNTVHTPSCSGSWNTGSWNTNFSAQILHYHDGMTDDQGGAYWCDPSNQPSWDPTKC